MNRKFFAGLAAIALVCAATTVGAQDPNYSLSLGDAAGTPGSSINVQAILDNNGMDIAGWSYGVCNDPALVQPTMVNDEDTSTVKNGAAADFNEKATFPEGWTQGVVICFTGCAVLPAGSLGYAMASADYGIDPAAALGTYADAFSYCDTLGVPPVATVVVVNGASIVPTTSGGDLEVLDDPCQGSNFSYIAPNDGPNNYPSTDGIGNLGLTLAFSILDDGVAGGCDADITQGFSMGCSNDDLLINPVDMTVAATLPFAPDFAESSTFPNGWTIGVVYSFTGANTLTFDAATPVVSVDYDGVAGALVGVEGITSTPLTWDDGLGNPPVANVVVVGGGSFAASFADGSVDLNGTTTLPFVRGDSNDDGIVNIADIIWLLSELFSGGPVTNCVSADDTNDDGATDAADAVTTANYIFLAGPAPAAPFPGCGTFAGQTPADCESYNSCP